MPLVVNSTVSSAPRSRPKMAQEEGCRRSRWWRTRAGRCGGTSVENPALAQSNEGVAVRFAANSCGWGPASQAAVPVRDPHATSSTAASPGWAAVVGGLSGWLRFSSPDALPAIQSVSDCRPKTGVEMVLKGRYFEKADEPDLARASTTFPESAGIGKVPDAGCASRSGGVGWPDCYPDKSRGVLVLGGGELVCLSTLWLRS